MSLHLHVYKDCMWCINGSNLSEIKWLKTSYVTGIYHNGNFVIGTKQLKCLFISQVYKDSMWCINGSKQNKRKLHTSDWKHLVGSLRQGGVFLAVIA